MVKPEIEVDEDADDDLDPHECSRRSMAAAKRRFQAQLSTAPATTKAVIVDHVEERGLEKVGTTLALGGTTAKMAMEKRLVPAFTTLEVSEIAAGPAAQMKRAIKLLPELPIFPQFTGVADIVYAQATGKPLAEIQAVTGNGKVFKSHLHALGEKEFPAMIRYGGPAFKIGFYLTVVGGVYTAAGRNK